MVVHLKPETESRLRELSATTGRAPDELVEDAMSGYLTELGEVRTAIHSSDFSGSPGLILTSSRSCVKYDELH